MKCRRAEDAGERGLQKSSKREGGMSEQVVILLLGAGLALVASRARKLWVASAGAGGR